MFSAQNATVDISPVSALVVTPSEEDRCALQKIFSHQRWTLDRVATIQDTLLRIVCCGPPSIIICESVLPDGDWKDVLHYLEALPRLPRLIVSSHLADDHLWGEVLNLLGYDVLSRPFDAREVIHVVSCGWASWHQHQNGQEWNGNAVHAEVDQRARTTAAPAWSNANTRTGNRSHVKIEF